MSNAKHLLREEYRKIRSDIPPYIRDTAKKSVANSFLQTSLFLSHTHFACYVPLADELDTSDIIHAILNTNKHCYLPILDTRKSNLLTFVEYKSGDDMRPNRYGILEPVNRTRVINPLLLDIVIAPLIAFDRKGHRLGTGGGYYDATFAFMNDPNAIRRPKFVGVAYSLQEAVLLPVDAWDINMDAVITNEEIIAMPKKT